MSRNVISFVLGATAHGPMIFSRLDYAVNLKGEAYGVGAELMWAGGYKPDEVMKLKALLELRRVRFGDGVVMLDCGANVGVHTVECGRLMRGWGKVVAFEPQERIFHALCGNVALNNLGNVRALMIALGNAGSGVGVPSVNYDEPASYGSLELGGPNDDLGQSLDGKGLTLTPIHQIDSFGYPRVDLIKVDVEGMELDVLKGAELTIGRCKPILWVDNDKVGPDKVAAALDALGYMAVKEGLNTLGVPKDATYVKLGEPSVDIEEAVAIGERGDTVAALARFDAHLAKCPTNQVARYNRATLLMQLNDFEGAIPEYDAVVRAAETGDEGASSVADLAAFGRGFANLVLGNLRVGFEDFERRKVPELPAVITTKPRLTRADMRFSQLDGQTVLVVGEMGFGDNIMFSRYFEMLHERGMHVMVSVPPPLETLFRALPHIQVHGQHSPTFNCWARMMSMAHLFETDIDTVPPPTRFVLPDEPAGKWRYAVNAMSGNGRLKVGLCWSGSRKSQYDKHRSIPLSALTPLLEIDGADFFSLQLDVREEDRPIYDTVDIFALGPKVKDFCDTACAISALDLVITVDTSVAHLAASMAVPTWVLLTSFRTYWLWIKGREDSPWYPSATAFRQEVDGEWGPVVERVVRKLRGGIEEIAAQHQQFTG